MSFTVRKFEDRDAERVAEIMYESFKSVFKERWGEEDRQDGDHWKKRAHAETPACITTSFVAEQDDGTVNGFLHVTANLHRKLGTLHIIGVDPGIFAKGAGRAMFVEAEKLWLKHRMRKVHTCTSHVNQRALAFYKRQGFEEEGLLKSHFFDGIDEIQLAKFYKYEN